MQIARVSRCLKPVSALSWNVSSLTAPDGLSSHRLRQMSTGFSKLSTAQKNLTAKSA